MPNCSPTLIGATGVVAQIRVGLQKQESVNFLLPQLGRGFKFRSHTLSAYTVHWEGGVEGGGGQREGTGTVEGQQYTSIVPSSMGATVHKLGRKYQPMSECSQCTVSRVYKIC